MQLSSLLDVMADSLSCSPVTIRGYRHRINFLIRHAGDIDLSTVTPEYFKAVRKSASDENIAASTIEASISQVFSLISRAGFRVDTGQPLKVPPPHVVFADPGHVDQAALHGSGWVPCFLSLAYVTGLRRSDLQSIRPSSLGDSLIRKANKTQKIQRFPLPKWCQRQCQKIDRFPRDEHAIYDGILAACRAAKVPYFTPQQIRRLSARTWERVQPGLGPLILGNSLPGWNDATRYYLDPFEGLFNRVCDFPPLPSLLTTEEKCAAESRRQRLIRTIERLTAEKQQTLLTVAEGLAG